MLKLVSIYFFVFSSSIIFAQQPCRLKVRFVALNEPHMHNIRIRCIEQNKTYFITDGSSLEVENFCKQFYHFDFLLNQDLIDKQYLLILSDTVIMFSVPVHQHELSTVNIVSKQRKKEIYFKEAMQNNQIVGEGYKDLSGVLQNFSGIDVIKNGSGVSKPLINGLWGNRIEIYNNGISQSGQQWGNDHAPEIDAFVSDKISVVRGANVLAYSSKSIGGAIFVESLPIMPDPHLHGQANYFYGTNGHEHVANVRLQKFSNTVSWRFVSTFKINGDKSTPMYYLTNSGKREYDIALFLEKKIKRWNHSIYASVFRTDLGIFKGSQISNVTDLNNAIIRSEPLFISNHFRYDFTAPEQQVMHTLLKVESFLHKNNQQHFSFLFSFQNNVRREYDLKRDLISKKLGLGLNQISITGDINYKTLFQQKTNFFVGYQGSYVLNENDALTANYPLIPDYLTINNAFFVIATKNFEYMTVEIGTRISHRMLNVFILKQPLNTGFDAERKNNMGFAASLSGRTFYARNNLFQFSASWINRFPEVNELYSWGLHQGVSSIEEGNKNLEDEKVFQINFSNDFHFFKHGLLQAYIFFNYFDNYIFLKPENSLRLTIRGAYPVFAYAQTRAQMYGCDLSLQLGAFRYFNSILKYSLVHGHNITENIPLVYMPPQKISNTYEVFLPRNYSVKVLFNYVFEQKNLLSTQDYAPPPKDYFLTHISLGKNIVLKRTSISVSMDINNLWNTPYRDYLNKQRYFADELGRNMVLKLNVAF